MSAPPFCPLGSGYYIEDGSLPIGFWTYKNGSFLQDGRFFYDDAVDAGSSYIRRVYTGAGTLTASFFFRVKALGFPVHGGHQQIYINGVNIFILTTNSFSQTKLYLQNQNSPTYGGVQIIYTLTYGEDFSLLCELVDDGTTIAIFIEGVLWATYNTPHLLSGTIRRIDFQLQSSPFGQNHGYDQMALMAPSMPTPCLGEIPTYHEVASDSTVKMSHARMIRADRNATQAQQFHNLMKGTT